MLEQAGQLEHCLLDTYLYAACSLKSTPQEWEKTQDGRLNKRRAILFERSRAWKQALLSVAREEMVHMHYVECLRRGLGERPALSLPPRDSKTNRWVIRNWQARIGDELVNDGDGVEVPVEPASLRLLRQFVLYESTDSLQNADPFDGEQMALFERLFEIEQDMAFERMLFAIEDDDRRQRIKAQLKPLYDDLAPVDDVKKALVDALAAEPELPPVDSLRFQSIADFYYKGVLPLYDQAFDRGWISHNNYLLNNEVVGEKAAEGFLGSLLVTGPVHRDKNFSEFRRSNVVNPLDHMDTAENIIRQIVEEGEGGSGFLRRAKAFIAWYAENGGEQGAGRAYQQALDADTQKARSGDPNYSTPTWLADAQLLRQSHLYKFAMVMVGLQREHVLAAKAGVVFEPARRPIDVTDDVALTLMKEQLPAQFNACYLVLLSWLSRIYELQTWEADKPRRLAIEMVATWPLMSMAIRPMLELASMFPIETTQLFRWDQDALPMLPVHAQQLRSLYLGDERNQEVNDEMDYLAVRVLEDVGNWARGCVEAVEAAKDIESNRRTMILTRLRELGHLDEFRKQFPFRVAGGYSNVPPDPAFANAAEEPERFEESPGGPKVLFRETLMLRLRFSGWGQVQLATDPDPTWDEVGCTGTQMLHAADGDKRFDTALVWQSDNPAETIMRGPEALLPKFGVECREASLLVAAGKASAGYVPLQVLSSAGAVQTSGVQMKPAVSGLEELLTLPTDAIVPGGSLPVNLRSKDGVRPFLNGLNHLVWRDGEPIDPFIFSVGARGSGEAATPLFEREIFNDGKALLEMSPLQRQNSSRSPVGFDSYQNVPEWALAALRPAEKKRLRSPQYPSNWLNHRALGLADELEKHLGGSGDQANTDQVVSFAERMRLVAVPRRTTAVWPRFLLHYGHTVSGASSDDSASNNPILGAFHDRTGLKLEPVARGARSKPNQRWFLSYTKGLMDTDALRDLVYGELYIPLQVSVDGRIRVSEAWSFSASMADAVKSYACSFDNPYWAPGTKVEGNERTIHVSDEITIVETLIEELPRGGYTYRMTGFPGISNYDGRFELSPPDGETVRLTWALEFDADSSRDVVAMLGALGGATRTMTQRMQAHFGPASAS